MVPSYDFDIQWLIPRDAEADPAITKLLDDVTLSGNSRGNCIALFRDPRVIAMIEQADPVLREYLKASGFGFIAYQSGAPAGYFPAVDHAARADVISRLDENRIRFELRGADLGGFDFSAFFKSIAEGQPLATLDDADKDTPAVSGETRPWREPDYMATPTGFAKFTGRNRVLPLMVLSLAVVLGLYWVAQHMNAGPASF